MTMAQLFGGIFFLQNISVHTFKKVYIFIGFHFTLLYQNISVNTFKEVNIKRIFFVEKKGGVYILFVWTFKLLTYKETHVFNFETHSNYS